MKTDPYLFDDLAGVDAVSLPFSWNDLPRRSQPRRLCVDRGERSLGHRACGRAGDLAHRIAPVQDLRGGVVRVAGGGRRPCLAHRGRGATAEQLFHYEPSRVLILPPELMCSKVTTTQGGKRKELEIAFLPAVCSIGTFDSKESLEESGADGSEVVVVWFQGAFGPPEPGHVADSMRAIAWDRFACGLHEL